MTLPLRGKRVIEVGHMLMGPYCGMLLADLGAEVIKVEPPGGDIARRVSPHQVGPFNAYFASLNRGKRNVDWDLKSPAGRDAFRALLASSDVFIHNIRREANHGGQAVPAGDSCQNPEQRKGNAAQQRIPRRRGGVRGRVGPVSARRPPRRAPRRAPAP